MHRYLLPALAGIILAISALTAAAQAETYGELGHFGSTGTGHGEFRIKSGTHAFGVDPTDDSVYVGDEPAGGEYRIQKLTASGTYVADTAPFKPPNHDGIEGIAVDPVEKRIYVLALEKRGGELTIAPAQPAAGTLYAFSTEPSGETLVPATGTSAGVLAGPSTFKPQSDTPEQALLEPKGITVDPTTHDVIVLGQVAGEEEEEEAHPRVALERVHSNGELSGERYVDSTEFFGPTATPDSPVVSPAGAVYVNVQQAQLTEETSTDELAQIPSKFSSTAPPTPFADLTLKGTLEEEERPIVEFNANQPPKAGDGLSFAPEGPGGGSEGTIYARAQIFVHAGGKGAYYPGVLAFNGASGSELGWTGGQTKLSGSESCTIGFLGPSETYPSVAAGNKRTMFMLDTESAHVIEFGPEGKGCPAAEASEPIATVSGKPLSPSETIQTGTPVTFSSMMTQANALSVEWNFGDGQTQTESADEYQHTEVKLTHGFVQGGELTVTETIHTDDLATPTIVKTTKISVSGTAPPPTATLEGPSEVTLGKEATFDGSASSGSSPIEAYHWVFGDGVSETTETSTAKHLYKKAGVYTVELTVTDAHALTSEPSRLTIKVNEPTPETPKGGGTPPGGGGTGTLGAPPTETIVTTGDSHPPAGPPPVPDAGLAGTSLAVSPAGTVALDVTCPAGESSCAGTVTLRTVGAVSASAARSRHGHAKKPKASVLTLAGGTFTVTGGQEKSVELHLSAAARTLLIHMHTLRAQATLTAHDPSGATHVTQTLITLHAPQKLAKHSGKR